MEEKVEFESTRASGIVRVCAGGLHPRASPPLSLCHAFLISARARTARTHKHKHKHTNTRQGKEIESWKIQIPWISWCVSQKECV